MRERLWILAARMSVPGRLSLSRPARVVERWLTGNYLLQRKALLLVPWNTRVLLDIGCGGAAYLEWCLVPRKIGVDANPRRLKVARNYCGEVRRCDLEEGFPEIRADCVLCLEVVEHLSKGAGLRLLERLASYPVAIISTPREFFHVSRNSWEAHQSFWGEDELGMLGFELVERVRTPPSNIYVSRNGDGRKVVDSFSWYDTTLMPLALLVTVLEASKPFRFLSLVAAFVRQEMARMAKFGIAGGTGYLVHLGVLAGLTSGVGMFYLASAGIASVVNISWNFTFNELWTFRDRRRSHVARRYARYFALMMVTGGLYFGLLWAFTDGLGMFYMVSAVVALAAQICVNFVVSFGWVWRRK